MSILILRWILHWFGQGLKLVLFAFRASICLLPIYAILELLRNVAHDGDDLSLPIQLLIIAVSIVCYVIGLAIFTAVLATQLRDDPFRFTPNANQSLDQET